MDNNGHGHAHIHVHVHVDVHVHVHVQLHVKSSIAPFLNENLFNGNFMASNSGSSTKSLTMILPRGGLSLCQHVWYRYPRHSDTAFDRQLRNATFGHQQSPMTLVQDSNQNGTTGRCQTGYGHQRTSGSGGQYFVGQIDVENRQQPRSCQLFEVEQMGPWMPDLKSCLTNKGRDYCYNPAIIQDWTKRLVMVFSSTSPLHSRLLPERDD